MSLLTACGPSSTQAVVDTSVEREHSESLQRLTNALSRTDLYRFEDQMYRIMRAREFGLNDTATNDEIADLFREQRRQATALDLRLPPTATWEQISDARRVHRLRARALQLGLPADASEEQIRSVETERDQIENERNRLQLARQLGLPDTATLHEIWEHEEANNRREMARQHGLPETATWEQISRKIDEEDPTGVERALTLRRVREERHRLEIELNDLNRRFEALTRDLPETASLEDIEAYEVERVRRYSAINLGLHESTSWGGIYDATH